MTTTISLHPEMQQGSSGAPPPRGLRTRWRGEALVLPALVFLLVSSESHGDTHLGPVGHTNQDHGLPDTSTTDSRKTQAGLPMPPPEVPQVLPPWMAGENSRDHGTWSASWNDKEIRLAALMVETGFTLPPPSWQEPGGLAPPHTGSNPVLNPFLPDGAGGEAGIPVPRFPRGSKGMDEPDPVSPRDSPVPAPGTALLLACAWCRGRHRRRRSPAGS